MCFRTLTLHWSRRRWEIPTLPRRGPWPSEASAQRVDKTLFDIVGKCHRASFMRMMGFSVTNPADATGAWKWLMGRAIESGLTHQAKLAGIYAANGVKHFIRDITLSLEFDVIAVDPVDRRGWILECKSYSGYYAKKEIETMNKPKLENLIQICLYILEARTGKRLKAMIQKSLDERKVLDKKVRDAKKNGEVFDHRNRSEADKKMVKSMNDGPIGGKLLYVDRDSASRKEFTIEIYQDFDGFHYPQVDGVPFKIFTMESVYARYKTQQGYWFRARSSRRSEPGAEGHPSAAFIEAGVVRSGCGRWRRVRSEDAGRPDSREQLPDLVGRRGSPAAFLVLAAGRVRVVLFAGAR